jgi:hypothetical protein
VSGVAVLLQGRSEIRPYRGEWESAILGNYAAYIRRTHPNAPTPAVYRSEKLLENADSHRQALGDTKFLAQLNQRSGQAAPSDGWGSIIAGSQVTRRHR